MGLPQLGNGPAYEIPPEDIIVLSPKLYDYLLMIHAQLFGVPTGTGALNDINVNQSSHSNLSGVTSYQHHGAGQHSALAQAAASSDASASSVSVTTANATVSAVAVTTADADATYGTEEQNLINELKADLNTLVTDVNTSANLANEIKGDVNTLVTDVNAIRTSLNGLKAVLRTAGLLAT